MEYRYSSGVAIKKDVLITDIYFVVEYLVYSSMATLSMYVHGEIITYKEVKETCI